MICVEKYKAAVEEFIAKKGYLDNPKVLGIVVCGSYTTGYERKGSDVDVHVIMKSGLLERITKRIKIYRGAMITEIKPDTEETKGFKIEYFEKPISDLYASARNDFENHSNALLPIIGLGTVAYSKGKKLEKLREYIVKRYSNSLPPLMGDDAREKIVIDAGKVDKLKLMINRPEFDYYYHYVIREIRKDYSRMCGCADVPEDKVKRLYTDAAYREAFCKSDIPDQEFVEMFITAITTEMTRDEKIQMAEKLFAHMNKKYAVDPDNYEIKVRSRNDWKSPHNI